jgi:hypothetical protein
VTIMPSTAAAPYISQCFLPSPSSTLIRGITWRLRWHYKGAIFSPPNAEFTPTLLFFRVTTHETPQSSNSQLQLAILSATFCISKSFEREKLLEGKIWRPKTRFGSALQEENVRNYNSYFRKVKLEF